MRGVLDTIQIDRSLLKLASDQLGIVTRSQALVAGVTDRSLTRRVQSGLIERVHVGVFRTVGFEPTFAQKCLSGCLAVHGAVLTGRSAAVMHAFPVGRPPSKPEIELPHESNYRGQGVTVRRTRLPGESEPWFTSRIATPSATLVALTPLLERPQLARCIDFAVAHRLIAVQRLLADVRTKPASRFQGRDILLDELLKRSDGRVLHRSHTERKVFDWCRRSGLSRPKPNRLVETSIGKLEVDFAWPAEKVILEVSPFHTHGSERAQARDVERRRALVAAGWRIVEANDADLDSYSAFGRTAAVLAAVLGT